MEGTMPDEAVVEIPQGESIDSENAFPSPIPEDWKSSRNESAQDWFSKASEDTLRCVFPLYVTNHVEHLHVVYTYMEGGVDSTSANMQ